MCSLLPTPAMVSRVFFAKKSNVHRVQLPKHPCTKVILSAEAQKILKLNWKEKTEQFNQDLNAAFEKLDEMMTTITSKHGKSVHYVKTGLYLGHAKFSTKRKKINTWNVFCWKKHQLAQDQNDMCISDAEYLINLCCR